MPAAPLPPDERQRLAALHALALLDTPHDERFSSFTRVARTLAGTPIAALSLVDADRQWFKAREGLSMCETPRTQALCAYAILDPSSVLVVPDARTDPRFADNPLVTGAPGIRFYAGAPVLSPSGHAIGTLCVIDTEPRQNRNDQPDDLPQRLADLARGVGEMLTLNVALRHLHGLVTHDPLTGLVNRSGFDTAMAKLGTTQSEAALLLLDLDGFKQINDLLGHSVGDATLVAVANRLRETGAADACLARLGGDEFAVLIEKPVRASLLARRIHAALSPPLLVDGHRVRAATAIGVARFPGDGADADAVFRAADAALYRAKARGRARTAFASAAARTSDPQYGRTSIITMLRDALLPPGHEPFTLAWQPIVDATSGTPRSYEALLRWPRGDAPMLMPGDFIPHAEKTGLIVHLDRWVLGAASSAAASWAQATSIAVNLSPPNLLLTDLPEVVEVALARSGLAPNRLVLEITEAVLVENRESVRGAILALQRMGVRIALDDFGEGASSFMYLRDLPFDMVKIDRRFVANAGNCPRTAKVLAGIIHLVHELGAVSIAEGVETAEQAAMLRAQGVHAMQGWHFGRPGPIPAIVTGEPDTTANAA